MNKKGFTLIELLAVIVILAIIALIATPIILGIINDARESAKKRSAELVYTGVQYAITSYMYNHEGYVPKTIADIKPGFDVENAIMDDNGNVTTEDDVTCTVTPETTGWKVDCDSYLTKTVEVATK